LHLVERARAAGLQLTIDMESRHWTDWTLELVNDLAQRGHDHVGLVLQTRLNRTAQDLSRLPAGIRVRLVIGIYLEPTEVAVQDKRVMKERMLDYARTLLARGHYVEFATHDEAFVHRFVEEVVPAAQVGSDRFEVQMLYGVPRGALFARLRQGTLGHTGPVRCRLYVPYALAWARAIAYLRRRLREHPQMALYVLRNQVRSWLGTRAPR
jgi:proline dehydrogenase